ncbi:unnamed protein product [Mycena citricolor]|uniref:Uncharacterized protein n=1 Tax=Mycena citricolor TaxID=2018698 RepID=A0AAD2H6N7_9AGAR|nr:unnamed protein product [Mycena citricolor]
MVIRDVERKVGSDDGGDIMVVRGHDCKEREHCEMNLHSRGSRVDQHSPPQPKSGNKAVYPRSGQIRHHDLLQARRHQLYFSSLPLQHTGESALCAVCVSNLAEQAMGF